MHIVCDNIYIVLFQVGDLYYQDPNGLNLSLEYWAPVASNTQTGIAIQVPHRQVCMGRGEY